MPTFIPPYMGEEIKSNAEKKMFEILKTLDTEETYILHSLGLPKHQNKTYGEIDFVVVSKRGVACLEIKGGRVECKEGKWIFTDRYGVRREKAEGPFAQVIGNMFSLSKELKSKFPSNPHIKNILVSAGVVFPDIEFKSTSQEIIQEMIYDSKTESIKTYLDGVFDYWESRQHRPPAKLSKNDVKLLVDYFRGDFSFVPLLSDRLNYVEGRLIRLTREQSMIMEALGRNHRLLIEGGAGTGKTVMAIDFVRKRVSLGEKVLYLTFNKNLAHSISLQLEEGAKLKISNLHALFGEFIPVDIEKMKEDSAKYFNEVLPEAFFDWMSALPEEELEKLQYDLIVIDEGQDILKPIYLYSLDMLLKGGLKDGSWAIFYDERQNIYNPEFEEGMDIIKGYPSAKFNLYTNCRNTLQIGTYSSKTSGIEMKEFLREAGQFYD